MKTHLPLVWVHLGPSRVSKHLKRSIKTHAISFPESSLILLVDEERNVEDFALDNVKVIKVSIESEDWNFIEKTLNHDRTFRNGFWFTSLARFKALSIFMASEGIYQLLHIESDVVLMPNFPFSKFAQMDDRLAYCLQGEGQGIAAILFVGSKDTLNNFLRFCVEEVKRNPKSTDMTILYRYWIEKPHQVLILPSLPNNSCKPDDYPGTPKVISENLDTFGGIFDPISIGQYLLGIDPRNSRGRRILFREDETHYLKVSQLKLEIVQDSLLLDRRGKRYPIFSLHVHSKDLRAFGTLSLKQLLRKRILEMDQGEASELSIREWFKSGYGASRRRIHQRGQK
jgi:hypothetical protein